jgi:hypothetical protein
LLPAVADQVGAPHLLQGFAQQRPVVGVVIAQESLVQAALAAPRTVSTARRIAADLLQRVPAAVIHGRGNRHRRRQEGLHLIEAEVVALQPQRQIEHVLVGGARMRGDEVRDQVLLLAGLLRELLEHRLELLVGTHAGLHHVRQRPVLRCARARS